MLYSLTKKGPDGYITCYIVGYMMCYITKNYYSTRHITVFWL